MKKLSFVLAAAGLMTLAACGEKTPVEENVTVNETVIDEGDNMMMNESEPMNSMDEAPANEM